ncbi:MAG TPA: DUF547 domain-containing protein [Polyangia bacterium]|nr:DUF547 domain-containing protein [Polyangia bacterium]
MRIALAVVAVLAVGVVALVGARALAATIKPDAAAVAAAKVPFPYAEWDALLKKYVDDQGRVDYAAVNRDGRAAFDKVFAAVAASSPKKNPAQYPTAEAQKAYYLDAYNVLVWKDVLGRLPKLKNVDSEKVSFFYFTKFSVGGADMNLYDLENKIVRPQFKDARVHFALNCASGGCPMLPRDAFTPDKVDAQLSREARKFVNERRNVDFDPATKRLKLSHIFDWYKEDFGKEPAKVIAWINHYRDADAQLPTDAKIDYVDYDWTLNDVHLLNR